MKSYVIAGLFKCLVLSFLTRYGGVRTSEARETLVSLTEIMYSTRDWKNILATLRQCFCRTGIISANTVLFYGYIINESLQLGNRNLVWRQTITVSVHFISLGSWMFVVCCQVEVSATGRSLVQRSPTACGVSLCAIKWIITLYS